MVITERISDLDDLLLANVYSTTALRRHVGRYTFATYVRRDDGGLAPREADVGLSYAPKGLSVAVHCGDHHLNSGFVAASDDRMVELLRREEISLHQSVTPDSFDRVSLSMLDGLSVTAVGEAVNPTGLTYLGDGVYLPAALLERITQPVKITEKLSSMPAPTLSAAGYYPINPRDNAVAKTATFFANLGLRKEYLDGKFILNGRHYGFQQGLPERDVESLLKQNVQILRQQRRTLQEVIPELARFEPHYHPLNVLYSLHYPEGRQFSSTASIMSALFLDEEGLEVMKKEVLEMEGKGILRSSVIEAYTELHKIVWNYVAGHGFTVPALETEEASTARTETAVQKSDPHQLVGGKTFQSLAILQPDGSYVLPLLLAGRMLPISVEARLLISDTTRVITREGVVGTIAKDKSPLRDDKNRVVTYRCSPDQSTIQIERIDSSDLGLDRLVRFASVAAIAPHPSVVERAAPVLAVPPARVERAELPATPAGTDGGRTISTLQYDPNAPPPGAIVSAGKIAAACAVDSGTFARERDSLIRDGLLYRRPVDGALWTPADAIPTIRERLGKPTSRVEPTASPGADARALVPPLRLPPSEAPDEDYDPKIHVPLGTLVNELASFSDHSERIHPSLLGRAAQEFSKVLHRDESGKRFSFIRREDVSDVVTLFDGDTRLTLDSATRAGIHAVYSLGVVMRDETLPSTTVDIDRLLQERGLECKTEAFYRARHHLAQSPIKDRLRLRDGKFLVGPAEDRREIDRILDGYLGEGTARDNTLGSAGRSAGTVIRSSGLGGRASSPQPADDNGSFYRACAENLVAQGIVTTGTRPNNFYGHMKLKFGVDRVPDGSALFSYVQALAKIGFEEARKVEPLDTAVERLKQELGLGDDDALSVLERKLQVTGTSVPRVPLLTHIARELFVREHPYFADKVAS